MHKIVHLIFLLNSRCESSWSSPIPKSMKKASHPRRRNGSTRKDIEHQPSTSSRKSWKTDETSSRICAGPVESEIAEASHRSYPISMPLQFNNSVAMLRNEHILEPLLRLETHLYSAKLRICAVASYRFLVGYAYDLFCSSLFVV